MRMYVADMGYLWNFSLTGDKGLEVSSWTTYVQNSKSGTITHPHTIHNAMD